VGHELKATGKKDHILNPILPQLTIFTRENKFI
jgi:hypothetical protein